jgi:hypothetical protein
MRCMIVAIFVWLGMAGVALGQLKFERIEASDGPLGPLRQREGYFANEEIHFRYVIAGLKVDGEGYADTSLKLVLKDSQGTTLLDQDTPSNGLLALGGATMPGSAFLMLNEQARPGDYDMTVTLTDKIARHEVKFSRTIKLLATEFAVLAPQYFYDEQGTIAAPNGGPLGKSLYLQVKSIGFDRTKGRIDSEMTIDLLNSQRQRVTHKPIHAEVRSDDKMVVENAPFLSFNAQFALNRVGDFKIRITVHDKIAGLKATFEGPLTVTAP